MPEWSGGIGGYRSRLFEWEMDKYGKQEAMRMAEMYLDNHDTEIAYHLEAAGRYFSIQTVSEGYDYTFYDNHFRELDGGIYDNPDISLQEAMKDILEDEGMSLSDCKVMVLRNCRRKSMKQRQERYRENC